MEDQSAPEQPRPERPFLRPPGLEMGNGLAIFSLVFLVFMAAQYYFSAREIVQRTPELQARGLSPGLLQDATFTENAEVLLKNGDVVSRVTCFSDIAGLVVLVSFVWLWKRSRSTQFLGLRPPAFRPLLAWMALFIGVLALLEGITYLLPEVDDSFMENVRATATDRPMLYIGAALMPAVFEEFFLRGLLLGSLRHLLDKHAAIAITAGVFTVMHMQYPWYLLLLVVLPLGVVLGYARANTGSIWTPILLHFTNNVLSLAVPQLP